MMRAAGRCFSLGFVLGFVVLLIAAGCTTSFRGKPSPPPTGDSSWRQVVPSGIKRYELPMGSVASGAAAVERVAPIYPPDQLAACPPPQDVDALLIVDERGKVGEVRVADELQADARRRQFIAAVRTAALKWSFQPLQIDHWAADANGNSHVVDTQTWPFSLNYAFRFACHAGKAAVSTDVAPG
jgi:hypothetical protein